MATSSHSPTAPRSDTYECDRRDCEETFTKATAVRGSFCSSTCYYRHRGAGALKEVDADHKFCSSCFQQVKTVERPGEALLRANGVKASIREAIVGWQFPTEHAEEHAVDVDRRFKERVDDADQPSLEDVVLSGDAPRMREPPHVELSDGTAGEPVIRGTIGCECGAVDLHDRDATLGDVVGGAQLAQQCYECLLTMEAHGTLQHRPDPEQLVAAMRKHWRDWEFVVGRALFA